MLCFVALFAFAALSIFSAKYRPFAARAFDCVVKKMTLRKCETGLDEEIKARGLSEIMRFSPGTAAFANRHFEAISIVFTLLFFASLIFAAQGLLNFVIYGNCNGPEGGFCIYSGIQNENFLKAPANLEGFAEGSPDANVTLVEFGCYTCPYTKEAEAGVREIVSRYSDRIYYVFKPFPLENHPYSHETALAAYCANSSGKYWEYRNALFENQDAIKANGTAELSLLAQELNVTGFDSCFEGKMFEQQVKASVEECKQSGIYGTPTFFVNGKPYVGQNAIDRAEAEIKRLLGDGHGD